MAALVQVVVVVSRWWVWCPGGGCGVQVVGVVAVVAVMAVVVVVAVLWLLLRFHWGSALLVLPAATGLSSFHWTFKSPLGSSCCSADVKLLH